MEVYGYIYLLKNNINNKLYIGQTINGFDKRYMGNIALNTHNDHLKKAIEKYGIDNFTINKEFDIAYNKEDLDLLEDMYIKLYETTNSDYGYNKQFGGSHGKPSEESRRKMSEARKGNTNMLGHTHTEEAKRKMSKAKKGKYTYENSHKAEKVYCLNTGEEFDCMARACDKYGLDSSNLSDCAKGERKYCGMLDNKPLIWSYERQSEEEFNKRYFDAITKGFRKKAVYCITTDKTFLSLQLGAEFYDFDSRRISENISGRKKTGGRNKETNEKLVWKEITSYEEFVSLGGEFDGYIGNRCNI